MPLSPSEIAWIAGLLEGEGHFGLRQRKSLDITVTLAMKDLDVVKKFGDLLDGDRHIGCYDRKGQKGYKSNHAPIYVLTVRGYAAERLMRTILPHMGERRWTRIKEILKVWEERPNKTRERGLPTECHPERKHYSRGLCYGCYNDWYRSI